MTTATRAKSFPGETEAYRIARNRLLETEIQLRRQIEETAAQRRTLPLGGAVPEDYLFEENGERGIRQVRLSELFAEGKDTLILYSLMYGPEMDHPCTSCTSIVDGINGAAPHVTQWVNLAVVAKSPMERIRAFADQRNWGNLQLLSSARCTYNRDYHGEDEEGDQWPALNVFVKRGDRIFHWYSAELLFAPEEPGQDGRHVDLIWSLWNLLDLTPEGRGETWYPQLSYH